VQNAAQAAHHAHPIVRTRAAVVGPDGRVVCRPIARTASGEEFAAARPVDIPRFEPKRLPQAANE